MLKQKKKVACVNKYHVTINSVDTSCITSERIKFSYSVDPNKKKYPSRIGERILLYTKDYQKDEIVTCLLVFYAAYL